ncbi:12072_t:CDS:1, partial [Racocetra persica]
QLMDLKKDLKYLVYLRSEYKFSKLLYNEEKVKKKLKYILTEYLDPAIKTQFENIETTRIYQRNIDLIKQASLIQEALNYITTVKPPPSAILRTYRNTIYELHYIQKGYNRRYFNTDPPVSLESPPNIRI